MNDDSHMDSKNTDSLKRGNAVAGAMNVGTLGLVPELVNEYAEACEYLRSLPTKMSENASASRQKMSDELPQRMRKLYGESHSELLRKALSATINCDSESAQCEWMEVDKSAKKIYETEILSAGRQIAQLKACANATKEWADQRLKTIADGFVASIEALVGNNSRTYRDYDFPCDELELNTDGSIRTAVIPHRKRRSIDGTRTTDDAIPVALIEYRICGNGRTISDPYCLPSDRLNVIVIPDGTDSIREKCSTAENIIANIVYQDFFMYAPDVDIVLCSENPHIHNLDRDLTQESVFTDRIRIVRDRRELEKIIEGYVKEQPADIYSYRKKKPNDRKKEMIVAYAIPEMVDGHQAEDLRRLIAEWAAQLPRGLHLYIVGHENALNACKVVDADFGIGLFSKNVFPLSPESFGHNSGLPCDLIEVCGIRADAMVDEGEYNKKVMAMKAILRPPRRVIEGAIRVVFAYTASHEPKMLEYTADEASSLFLTGAPGTGKSFTLNSFIYNACENYSPDQLQLLLLDCKNCVEMMKFRTLPHVKCVVNADFDVLVGMMAYVKREMECRNAIFGQYGGNIDAYNSYRKTHPELQAKPRILFIVDELGRILAKSDDDQSEKKRKAVIANFNELVAQTRSVGIHYLFATQQDSELTDFFKSKDLLTYRAKLHKTDDGRRSVTLKNLLKERDNEERFYPKEESDPDRRFTPADLAPVKAKWTAYADQRPVVCNEVAELPDWQEYPNGSTQLKDVLSQANTESLSLPAGMDVENIFNLYSVTYANKIDKPNLFVAGDLEHADENKRTACLSFILMQLQSLVVLSGLGTRVNAEIILDESKSAGEFMKFKEEKEIHLHFGSDGFARGLKQWIRVKESSPDTWNFLFVINADKYLDGKKAKNITWPEEEKRQSTEQQEKANVPMPSGSLSFSERMARLKSLSASVNSQTKAMENKPNVEHQSPAETLRTRAYESSSRSIMLIHSASPSSVVEYLRGRDNAELNAFRFAYFMLSNRGIGANVSYPTSYKLGQLSKTYLSDVGKHGFIPFRNFG